MPLDKFVATSFGRPLKDAGPVAPQEINGLGFLLGEAIDIEALKVLGGPDLEPQDFENEVCMLH